MTPVNTDEVIRSFIMLTGYKFESIRVLHTEHVIAWEMLSTAKPHVNLEDYFGSMSFTQRKQHFFAQLRHAMACLDSSKYYLNVTSDLLLDEDFIDRLREETPRPQRLAIELTDLEKIVHLPEEETRELRLRIASLRRFGIEVWADDVHEAILPGLLACQFYFYGIKIDKHAFWSGREERERFLQLARNCKKLASKVLIEGIETFGDFALARASAAEYGQGYLWNKQ